MPSNTKDFNSHILLNNLGIKREQVSQIRFMCNETFEENRYFMHFSTSNNDVIETAFTGDQSSLSPLTWKSGFKNLGKPKGWDKFKERMGRVEIKSLNFANKTKNGGMAITPFGSSQYGSFWTVVGEDPRNPIFECGSFHRSISDAIGNKSPSQALTHHSIFFRGVAPTDETVRTRMLAKINRRAFIG